MVHFFRPNSHLSKWRLTKAIITLLLPRRQLSNVDSEEKGKVLSLFKMNGARLLDENVTVKGNQKPWTLGNYLLLMRKSPSNVKLGVGYFSPLPENVTGSSSSSSSDSLSEAEGQTPSEVSLCLSILKLDTLLQ